jgi:signal transduction histidine kinase/ligand-binding sensor domain-containing protein
MRAIALAVLLALLPSPAAARELWRFRTFTTRDGLAHDIVRDVLEARDGALWFATMGGVTRYDPQRCRYQTFSDATSPARQQVMSLAEGKDGALWAATQGGGVGRYHGGRWTWFTTRDGLPADELSSLLVDRRGHVWAIPTTGGAARFDGARWRTFTAADGLPAAEISRCDELRSGEILCGVHDLQALLRFDGARWHRLALEVAAGTPFHVHMLFESADGQLWLGTNGAGVLRCRSASASYACVAVDTPERRIAGRIGALRVARDGVLWLSTSAGVIRYDGLSWVTFSRHDGLGSNHVFAITQTRDGALWFATLGGGASRYAPSRWEQVSVADGLADENVRALLRADDNALWAGTDHGLSVQRAGRWSRLQTGNAERDAINDLLQAKDGAIWIATRRGARRFAGGAWRELSPAPSPSSQPASSQPAAEGSVAVNRIAEDGHRAIWMATSSGVSVLASSGAWAHYGRAQGLPSMRVNDLIIDRGGHPWVATDSGVASFDGARWRADLGASPGRTSRIRVLAMDAGGDLWAAGLDGIHRLDARRWLPLPPSSWLPAGTYFRSVAATSDGSMWFAVRGLGIRRLRGGHWTAYSTSDGLASDTVNDVILDRDGSLLFATGGGGISRYQQDHRPPRTYIGPGTGASGVPTSILQGEDVVINFGGQDVLKDTETRDLVFSYRVDGGSWSTFTPSTRAWLSGLRAGAHLFEVRAMDQDLNVDPTPARHEFRVVRRWWTEPWLLTLVACTLLLGIYAVVRLVRAAARERAAILKEQATLGERRQFVRLASHELRKPLARLAHRAEVLLSLQDPEKSRSYAEAIVEDSRSLAKMVETLLDQARIQEGLQLDRISGDLREVVRRVVAELERDPSLSEDERARVRYAAPADPVRVRHDAVYLPLALHNLLDNAIKYAPDALVEVSVSVDRDRAEVVVRDEGPGIPEEDRGRIFEAFYRGKNLSAEHSGFGLGLSFARDIARAHGGELALRPSERGSTFCLSLPIEGEDHGTAADHR